MITQSRSIFYYLRNVPCFEHCQCAILLYTFANIWCLFSVRSLQNFYRSFLGNTSGPPPSSSSGNSALLGGVVKGANSLFSNIKDMSNKVMQSVAG